MNLEVTTNTIVYNDPPISAPEGTTRSLQPPGDWPHSAQNATSPSSHNSTDGASGLVYMLAVFFCCFALSVMKIRCMENRENRLKNRQEMLRKKFIKSTLVQKTVIAKQTPTLQQQERGSESTTEQLLSDTATTASPQSLTNEALAPVSPTSPSSPLNTTQQKRHQHKQQKNFLRRQKTNLVIYSDGKNDDNDRGGEVEDLVCPICLSPFLEKERICWSNNVNCDHTFHVLCIEPWLMKHDECPCCRNAYLVPGDKIIMEHKDEEAGRANDPLDARVTGSDSSIAVAHAANDSNNNNNSDSSLPEPRRNSFVSSNLHDWAIAFLRARSLAGEP